MTNQYNFKISKAKHYLCHFIVTLLSYLLTVSPVWAVVENADWKSVTTFNSLADTLKNKSKSATIPYRERAGLYLAMFSAANTVETRYKKYITEMSSNTGDPDLAAAFAGLAYLKLIHPTTNKEFVKLELQLQEEVAGAELASYHAIAQRAALLSLKRINQQLNEIPDYRPFTIAGRYVPTSIPRSHSIGLVLKPFVLNSPSAIRPLGPPELDSDLYARDFHEVQKYGRRFNSARTIEQTKEAVLWIEFKAWEWLPELLAKQGGDLLEQSRIAMLFQMAMFDGKSAMIDSKVHFQFWRPITAIRRAELDEREDTSVDAGWLPLLATPNHEEYLSGHCQEAATAAYILNALLPLSNTHRLTAPLKDYSQRIKDKLKAVNFDLFMLAEITTSLDSYKEFRNRKCDSRIFAGAHFRTTNEHSIKLGEIAAKAVLRNVATPVVLTDSY
jgi:hypothetical protein